jgi:hypothetical protein
MENMEDFCVSHNYTQKDLLLVRRRRRRRHNVEIPPKTRHKQKQSETHYEIIIH